MTAKRRTTKRTPRAPSGKARAAHPPHAERRTPHAVRTPSPPAHPHSPGFLALVADAKTRVREVAADEVQGRLDRGERFHFLDVREDTEWAVDHARGATHLGKGIIERDIETTIPDKAADFVCYCGGGFRSALVADTLQKMGYTHVRSMAGGIRAWRAAGYPLLADAR